MSAQVANPRCWTESFLAALEATGNVSAAARSVGLHRSTVYERRETDAAFRAAWDQAIDVATDALETEARRRAMGWTTDNGVFLYSDRMLEILLKGHRPERFRDNVQHQHDGQVTVRVEYADLHSDAPPAPSGSASGPL